MQGGIWELIVENIRVIGFQGLSISQPMLERKKSKYPCITNFEKIYEGKYHELGIRDNTINTLLES